jgi:hypothetical protein
MTTLQNGLKFVSKHKGAVATSAGGAAVALGIGGALLLARSRKKVKKRKGTSRRKTRTYGRKQKQPHTAGKRRDTSRRRIRYTKNNQPYVILASGKARFISKKSTRISRKRKGGRY